MSSRLDELVGVRFPPERRLRWFRATWSPVSPDQWVVAPLDGQERVGRVVVGRGQCLSYPGDLEGLPTLLRPARDDERPAPPHGEARRLLDSLP